MTEHSLNSFERKVATFTSIGVIALLVFLLIRNQEFADPNLVVIARILMSLAVAVIGATIPGFLNLDWNLKGLVVRAGGALALFVLTFISTPKVIQVEKGTIEEDEISPLVQPALISMQKLISFIVPAVNAEEIAASPVYVRSALKGVSEAQRSDYDIILSNNSDEQILLTSFRVKWIYIRGPFSSVNYGAAIKPIAQYSLPLFIDPDNAKILCRRKQAMYPPILMPPRNESGPSITNVRIEMLYSFEGSRIDWHPSTPWDVYYKVEIIDEKDRVIEVLSQSWNEGSLEAPFESIILNIAPDNISEKEMLEICDGKKS
ncbi:hypothetical protein BGP77_11585 [Saccharospirillum sp. MSK14-1]|uniref:hypothetical protein n=1 Tax=Saccharospirillum sp. MSK14-1 TaxID=1897632 RepID=UPI000D361E85|nr:hypothetical protein [Saccharospirillum sp. MSK14-1]PTY38580.1 hypothetical protein BGP77_11585 [Saccharospirillum sp. MSK14-1]